MVAFFVPIMVPVFGTSLINDISNLGLLSGLKICLDAGDSNSYDGTSQVWRDLSGNGSNFNRGSGSGSDGADPTFHGTAGEETSSEYFSYDGGDYFTIGANTTLINSLSKDNAAFSVLLVAYTPSAIGTQYGYVGSAFTSPTPGLTWALETSPSFHVYGVSAADELHKSSVLTPQLPGWNLNGLSIDEASAAGRFVVNGGQETFVATYASLTTSDPGSLFQIGALGNNTAPETSGNRVAAFAMWSRALSSAEWTNLYSVLKAKFSLP